MVKVLQILNIKNVFVNAINWNYNVYLIRNADGDKGSNILFLSRKSSIKLNSTGNILAFHSQISKSINMTQLS